MAPIVPVRFQQTMESDLLPGIMLLLGMFLIIPMPLRLFPWVC